MSPSFETLRLLKDFGLWFKENGNDLGQECIETSDACERYRKALQVISRLIQSGDFSADTIQEIATGALEYDQAEDEEKSA